MSSSDLDKYFVNNLKIEINAKIILQITEKNVTYKSVIRCKLFNWWNKGSGHLIVNGILNRILN